VSWDETQKKRLINYRDVQECTKSRYFLFYHQLVGNYSLKFVCEILKFKIFIIYYIYTVRHKNCILFTGTISTVSLQNYHFWHKVAHENIPSADWLILFVRLKTENQLIKFEAVSNFKFLTWWDILQWAKCHWWGDWPMESSPSCMFQSQRKAF